jgi:hypothetical protein
VPTRAIGAVPAASECRNPLKLEETENRPGVAPMWRALCWVLGHCAARSSAWGPPDRAPTQRPGELVNLTTLENRTELSITAGAVLPELSFDALRERWGHLAERKLIIAVLEDAIMCYQKYMFAKSAQDRRIFDQAENWLMRRDRRGRKDDSFSFDFICDALGLDPDTLREELRRWKQVKEAGPFVSSRQRCRWRAVYREPYKNGGEGYDEALAACG